ncbi:MAG: aspartate aminotransferase family protein [SAR202 cluster bacterium]|nr:aspartate aminotransferase family protein [SAR202 cluster bacterium]|tara:strand:+ start:1372 stop:2733 length:1362 start_codon:yes stop_codon:yes gene_type:complete
MVLSGEDLEIIKQNAAEHFWPHAKQTDEMFGDNGITLVDSAQGVWVDDTDGNQWFDTLSSMWLVNLGHGRREIADAVHKQMTNISYSPGGTVTPVTAELAAKVASLSPDQDSRVYFVSGGSEAVETAMKMAKNFQYNIGERNRWKIISRRGSYHGGTLATMSLGGGIFPSSRFGPLVPGNIHIEQTDSYRGRCCASKGGCTLECAKELERAILHEGPSSVAAFIGEPISAAAGIHIPHPEYWPTIREICDKYGVVLICDEVINAFGRTGKVFATEHWGIKPDITTVAKALTSGYLPIGAAIASKKISSEFEGSEDSVFRQLITFGGNPASCAAGIENLRIMEDENIVQNSADMGDYLFEKLQQLKTHEIVGDVRGGKGLLCAVELVKNRETKEKFDPEFKLTDKANLLMKEHHLFGRAGDVIPIAPPLCINTDEIDHFVTQLDMVITKLEANF